MASRAQETTANTGYRLARVRSVETITPSMLRVGFEGDELRGIVPVSPDQSIKIFFPLPGQDRPQLPPELTEDGMSWYRSYLGMPEDIRPPMRTYTIRALRSERGEIDVDFVLHGDGGPASRWAQGAKSGDEVAFLGPHGLDEVPAASRWRLLVGDETALPAISAILEDMPQDGIARAFVEVDSEEDVQHLECPDDVDIRWVFRGGAPRGEQVLDALSAAEFPAGEPHAWIAGEADVVKRVRRHVVGERGVDKRAITFIGYWRLGKSEEDTGRDLVRDSA